MLPFAEHTGMYTVLMTQIIALICHGGHYWLWLLTFCCHQRCFLREAVEVDPPPSLQPQEFLFLQNLAVWWKSAQMYICVWCARNIGITDSRVDKIIFGGPAPCDRNAWSAPGSHCMTKSEEGMRVSPEQRTPVPEVGSKCQTVCLVLWENWVTQLKTAKCLIYWCN